MLALSGTAGNAGRIGQALDPLSNRVMQPSMSLFSPPGWCAPLVGWRRRRVLVLGPGRTFASVGLRIGYAHHLAPELEFGIEPTQELGGSADREIGPE